MNNKLTTQKAITKTSQEELAEQISQDLLEGSVDILDAYIRLKSMEEVIKKVKSKVEDEAINEAYKYGKGEHEAYGVKFQSNEGRRTFDFSGDAEYLRLKEELKEREAMLKALPYEMVDPETGEVATPPNIKYSKSSISIKFPK
jgi:transcriptional regulator of heat shock response